MKVIHKILAVFLLVLIATESFGISRYAHFCGGELTSESYFIQHKDCCCEDSDEMPADDCCSDEIIVSQHTANEALLTNEVNKTPKIDFISLSYLLPSFILAINSVYTESNKIDCISGFNDTSPPIRQLICCFLI